MIDRKALKAAREEAGLSQEELALAVGAAQQLICALESGAAKTSKFLPRIAMVLNKAPRDLDPDWLRIADAPDKRSAGAWLRRNKLIAALPTEDARPHLEEMERQRRLDTDYRFFANEVLRIWTKRGAIEPFVFNRAQQHIHRPLQAQLASTGRVRALILKGRQQGCSTYIGGRYYHRASRNKGLRVFILTHAQQATQRRGPRDFLRRSALRSPAELPWPGGNPMTAEIAILNKNGIALSP
jgi:transcriptional regulator with XRE-family HTH domain